MTSAVEERRAHETNARLFMALFLGSWSIGFVALFVAQLYIRLDAAVWPPIGSPPPPRLLTGLSTVAVLASSVVYQMGLWGVEKGRRGHLVLGLGTATALSLVFMTLQWAAGLQAVTRGLAWNQGVYATFFWVTAGFHYLHVAVGFAAGVWMWSRARVGLYTSENHLTVRLWAYYWHSIGLIWVLIYLLVFLL